MKKIALLLPTLALALCCRPLNSANYHQQQADRESWETALNYNPLFQIPRFNQFVATQNSTLQRIKQLLQADPQLQLPTSQVEKILSYTLLVGDFNFFQTLIPQLPELNSTLRSFVDEYSRLVSSEYSQRAAHGIDLLLRAGAALHSTSLITAARNGSIPIVRVLLSHDADTSATDGQGHTALMWAAKSSEITATRQTLMQLLAEHGAQLPTDNAVQRARLGRQPKRFLARYATKPAQKRQQTVTETLSQSPLAPTPLPRELVALICTFANSPFSQDAWNKKA